MTRKVVLDTETTGLEVERGHRVIEIGCVELVDRRPSGRTFQRYVNPERAIDPGAVAVHGITNEFLRDKPRFAEIAGDLVAFVDGAELLIHNAAFDTAFLDDELRRAGSVYGQLGDHVTIVDTLDLARKKYPGQKNTLDALCKRLGVDNSRREVHGALLDAHLLADVWVAMTAGQTDLALGSGEPHARNGATAVDPTIAGLDVRPRVLRASAEETAAHAARLDALDRASGQGSLWRRGDTVGG
ncbi:MAG TPA: DNA polymerase III subunit epsilon [Rhodanobacteraceae bacterium]|jgi:DNA polymerase-3 subunit epsilon|nr:DNA polymerase III subunit epsilon [Rhodanobacteraceae bacterium]